MAFQALDGPSKMFLLSSVGTVTPIEVKEGASAFVERKVLTLEGDAKFYVYLADEGETPSAGDVSSMGFLSYGPRESWEASGSQAVFVLAVTGTVNIRGAERA
jgi:hypothetical protein